MSEFLKILACCDQRAKHHSGFDKSTPRQARRPSPAPGRPRAPLRANPRLLPVLASRGSVSKRSPQKGGRKPELEAGALFLRHQHKMQETRNKMPATRVYLLGKLHIFSQFFVADSVTGCIIPQVVRSDRL